MTEVPENNKKNNVSDNLTNGNHAEDITTGTDVFSQQKGSFQHEERMEKQNRKKRHC